MLIEDLSLRVSLFFTCYRNKAVALFTIIAATRWVSVVARNRGA
jgi:energy-converting hydrogenase Eha subunit E